MLIVEEHMGRVSDVGMNGVIFFVGYTVVVYVGRLSDYNFFGYSSMSSKTTSL